MKLDLYLASACKDNGKPTQLAGCGMILIYVDEIKRSMLRTYNFALSNSTKNLADVQAVRLGLASVRSLHRSVPTVLHVDSNYAYRMLERKNGVFAANPLKNIEVVTQMRRWFSYYDDISVVEEDSDNIHMLQAADHANTALLTQQNADSGTMQMS